jgi:hypothetical protein
MVLGQGTVITQTILATQPLLSRQVVTYLQVSPLLITVFHLIIILFTAAFPHCHYHRPIAVTLLLKLIIVAILLFLIIVFIGIRGSCMAWLQ